MASQRGSKLNQIQQLVPEGLVVDAAWLDRHGFTHPLRQKYVAHGWLVSLARGVYQRPAARLGTQDAADVLDWERVLLSLQTLLDVGVSVGGRTALEVHGLAHYLPASNIREVHLYTREALPGWLAKIPVNARFVVHNPDRLLASPGRGLDSVMRTVVTGSGEQDLAPPSDVTQEDSDTTLRWGHWRWPLTLSTPERAVLELLDELPRRESFDQVDALFSGLGVVLPRRMQRLLEACRSIKVKRLFLFFADRHNHAWSKQLDRTRIDLGRGKRLLAVGGKLDPKYQITVPESLLQPSGDF